MQTDKPAIRKFTFKRLLRWGLGLFLVYAVVRLSIVIGVPKLYPNDAFVEQVKAICVREKTLCVRSLSQNQIVGPWWGQHVGLQAKAGKTADLRKLVFKEVIPADAKGRWGPWIFVGITVFEDNQLAPHEAAAQKKGTQGKP